MAGRRHCHVTIRRAGINQHRDWPNGPKWRRDWPTDVTQGHASITPGRWSRPCVYRNFARSSFIHQPAVCCLPTECHQTVCLALYFMPPMYKILYNAIIHQYPDSWIPFYRRHTVNRRQAVFRPEILFCFFKYVLLLWNCLYENFTGYPVDP